MKIVKKGLFFFFFGVKKKKDFGLGYSSKIGIFHRLPWWTVGGGANTCRYDCQRH